MGKGHFHGGSTSGTTMRMGPRDSRKDLNSLWRRSRPKNAGPKERPSIKMHDRPRRNIAISSRLFWPSAR